MTFSGLAMIKTTESSPPPTDLTFEEAVQVSISPTFYEQLFDI
jgi:hypothetical protein